jgi:FMN phosphatase YigB (HAD superfamily)
MPLRGTPSAIACDCFGTLLDASRPPDPAAAVAAALDSHGVAVPEDFEAAYRRPHHDYDGGREVSLVDHVAAALASRGVDPDHATVDRAVREAFDRSVTRRPGANRLLAAADCPVAVLSNCAVPGLVSRSLDRAGIDRGHLSAVVTSVDCGFRKPDERAFRAVADALGVAPDSLVHVGDDPETDGAVDRVGGRPILLEDHSLTDLAASLEASG